MKHIFKCIRKRIGSQKALFKCKNCSLEWDQYTFSNAREFSKHINTQYPKVRCGKLWKIYYKVRKAWYLSRYYLLYKR